MTQRGFEPARLRLPDMPAPSVVVRRRECLTVWLNMEDGTGIQVELHIDNEGTPRVMVPEEHRGVLTTFEAVYKSEAQP